MSFNFTIEGSNIEFETTKEIIVDRCCMENFCFIQNIYWEVLAYEFVVVLAGNRYWCNIDIVEY